MVLLGLAIDDAIHTFIYGLKLWLKGFVKAQAWEITDASLNKVMIIVLKLEVTFSMGSRHHEPSDPSGNFHHEDR